MKRQIVTIQDDISEIVFKFVRKGTIVRTVYIQNAQGLKTGAVEVIAADGDADVDWMRTELGKQKMFRNRQQTEAMSLKNMRK